MLYQIISHTPTWVFGLFAVLLALGLKQTRAGSMDLLRVCLMPVAMTALSIYGTVTAFGATPAVALAWLAAAGAMLAFVMRMPLSQEVRFDATSRTLQLPGTWVPLALMMGIFFTKYVVGVVLSMQPTLASNATFSVCLSALYGAFSGVFAARAVRLLRLALGGTRQLATHAYTANHAN
jgi:hypothetical protein